MKRIKKGISILLAVMKVITSCPVTLSADAATEESEPITSEKAAEKI